MRAAQYLRMSTDSQRYSLGNQASAIAEYAQANGIEVVRSYEDAGRSGVTTKGRDGLADLLADVVKGPDFSVVLVLDVSRWGRFQDPDEAAHYEFLCRSAGVEVRYCAERFGDDFTAPILKQLKRVMAGEYSRELSVKVQRGKRRHALLGHVQGSVCPYGIRRREVLDDGSDGRFLARRERKSRPEYSVRFWPGTNAEQAVVKEIFRLYVRRHLPPQAIADRLNARGIGWHDGSPWTGQRIVRLLRCELLAGRQITGKAINRMGRPRRTVPQADWELVHTFTPVVQPALFDAAQRRLTELHGSSGKTDAEMLGDLKRIFRKHGRVSIALIEKEVGRGKSSNYFCRFGSLSAAYERIGYRSIQPRRGSESDGQPMSRDAMVAGLQHLYSSKGSISLRLIRDAIALPSPYAYRKEFGSLANAYLAAGFTVSTDKLRRVSASTPVFL